MSLPTIPQTQKTAHERAAGRLAAARRELSLARQASAGAVGTPREHDAAAAVGGARAEVAAREEWLHWVDRGRSARPEADGEWGIAADAAAPAARALPPTIHRCGCGRLLRVFGGGRHRVFFELGDEVLADPVMGRVCAGCGRRLPGKNRP